jgi:hypothetical protein
MLGATVYTVQRRKGKYRGAGKCKTLRLVLTVSNPRRATISVGEGDCRGSVLHPARVWDVCSSRGRKFPIPARGTANTPQVSSQPVARCWLRAQTSQADGLQCPDTITPVRDERHERISHVHLLVDDRRRVLESAHSANVLLARSEEPVRCRTEREVDVGNSSWW